MKFNAIYEINVTMLAGSDIKTCCKEAVLLATTMNHVIKFSFNGTLVEAVPGDSVIDLVNAWHNPNGSFLARTGRSPYQKFLETKKKKSKKSKEQKPIRPPRRIVL